MHFAGIGTQMEAEIMNMQKLELDLEAKRRTKDGVMCKVQ